MTWGDRPPFVMSAANSGLPQGAFPGHEALTGHSRIKLAVFTVLGIHVAILMGVLIQGCKQTPPVSQTTPPAPLAAAPPANHAKAEAASGVPAPPPPPLIPVGGRVNHESTAPIEQTPEAHSPKVYIVVQGDGFYRIAKAHGISLKALAAANPGVDSNKLKIGQKLNLPEPK